MYWGSSVRRQMSKKEQPNKQSIANPQVIRFNHASVDIGIRQFSELLSLFQSLLSASQIDSNELEALTNRFIRLVARVFGSNSVEYTQYNSWNAYSQTFAFSMDIPDYEWERQCQERYRSGAQRTILELQAILDELEQVRRLEIHELHEVRADFELVLTLCKRLPQAQRCLSNRRFNKPAFSIEDEYDAQDLLHSLLKAYFKYSVQEQPLAKLANTSSRVDLAIEELETLIELKYAHGPKDQQRIVKEFAQDALLYTSCHWLKHFIYVIVNSQDLKDAEALEKLAGVQRLNDHEFTAYVVLI